jgi:predicted RNase H-related nuclease YkuK (DUF458 family)
MADDTAVVRVKVSTRDKIHSIKRQLAAQNNRSVDVAEAVDEIVRFYLEKHGGKA